MHTRRHDRAALAAAITAQFQGQSTVSQTEFAGTTHKHAGTYKLPHKHKALSAAPVASLRIASNRVERLFLWQRACADLPALVSLFHHINPRISHCHCRENKRSGDGNTRKLCLRYGRPRAASQTQLQR